MSSLPLLWRCPTNWTGLLYEPLITRRPASSAVSLLLLRVKSHANEDSTQSDTHAESLLHAWGWKRGTGYLHSAVAHLRMNIGTEHCIHTCKSHLHTCKSPVELMECEAVWSSVEYGGVSWQEMDKILRNCQRHVLQLLMEAWKAAFFTVLPFLSLPWVLKAPRSVSCSSHHMCPCQRWPWSLQLCRPYCKSTQDWGRAQQTSFRVHFSQYPTILLGFHGAFPAKVLQGQRRRGHCSRC